MNFQDTAIAFVGGGNMATAILGGLLKKGLPAARVQVVEPWAEARERLSRDFGVAASEQAGPALAQANLVVWAVKPQTFRDAAAAVAPHARGALHLSVAAGITSDSMARWLGTERIVRSMPNTPALVGRGMTALFARAAVSAPDRALVEQVLAPTGATLWVDAEAQLDAVTALSGSGPAYVFYFIEAMTRAGQEMGLPAGTAQQLAIGTFCGASELARASSEPPSVLRERVTSKGGTTHAALTSMEQSGVADRFVQAMHAACKRASELGAEFGRDRPAT
ncbi:pyrroline-5-carboxylate reductase [Ramlibacter henchirensis]|uniref:Pyrroline-5-carboxylate reductase n=1 Tax=Ramlibacter henchirensis TaxID=204072 RepID=A0A4Z0C9X3_9BURK|nr:pyrroline-5-carboxylate reductase [Ramlibacter henchirensis]TFZ06915.1 pyrroline-5-carboxylate reductase [Ramlibacter henchirensis]